MSARTSPDCARGTLNGRDGRPGPRTGEVRTAPVQAAALADRAAAHAPLDNPRGVAVLLDSLREAGAEQQAAALAERLPGAGMFELFREQGSLQDRFRFGREADGSPAGPWGWEDLD